MSVSSSDTEKARRSARPSIAEKRSWNVRWLTRPVRPSVVACSSTTSYMRAFCIDVATWLAITPSISRRSVGKAADRWAATVNVPMTWSLTMSGTTSSDS